MYKSKVWIHETEQEIENNKSPIWIDYTFIEKPEKNQIITITNDMVEDLSDKSLWENKFGPGKYLIKESQQMFSPKENDGLSHSVMVLKI